MRIPEDRLEDADDLVMSETPENGVLIPEETVDAVCVKIEKKYFSYYKHERWIFTFAVAFPECYCQKDLVMFVRSTPTASRYSKLYAAAAIGNGGPLEPRQKITARLFMNKMFRCKLRVAVPKTGTPYSVIDSLVEKLTG